MRKNKIHILLEQFYPRVCVGCPDQDDGFASQVLRPKISCVTNLKSIRGEWTLV